MSCLGKKKTQVWHFFCLKFNKPDYYQNTRVSHRSPLDQFVCPELQDGTANDVPSDFAVEGYPSMYFYSSGGNLLPYDGRTAEEIIDFITKNKGSRPGEATTTESVKDELWWPLGQWFSDSKFFFCFFTKRELHFAKHWFIQDELQSKIIFVLFFVGGVGSFRLGGAVQLTAWGHSSVLNLILYSSSRFPSTCSITNGFIHTCPPPPPFFFAPLKSVIVTSLHYIE